VVFKDEFLNFSASLFKTADFEEKDLMIKRIYVAATSQHVGKTTCTLGLTSSLRLHGLNVGYCKPVGQEFVDLGDLKVDKDALLFSTIMHFGLDPAQHSPVIVGSGLTKEYLEHPEAYDFSPRITRAIDSLEQQYDVVVMEGTGHPGVGSVIDLSNADVAKLVDAGVIMVVEGGIGSTIDELNVNLALFREQNVPILGVIINKVLPPKIEQVKYYVGKKLDRYGIPLIGIMPFDKSLTYPIMETILLAIKGKVVFHESQLDNHVEHIISGAMAERKEFPAMHHLLVMVNYKGLDRVIEAVAATAARENVKVCPFSGIIVHGEGDFVHEFVQNLQSKSYIDQHKIPVIATNLDTYGAARNINKIEVKINTRTLWKAERAMELFREHIDIAALL
jgi:dethiobiotin synthetase